MIKLDIVNQVADKTGVPKQKAEQVVDALFNAMKDALAKGKRIELRGFRRFRRQTAKTRHRSQSAHGQGSSDSGWQNDSFQTGQRSSGQSR